MENDAATLRSQDETKQGHEHDPDLVMGPHDWRAPRSSRLESFDNACQKYSETWKEDVDDDIKIGVVIKGMETGPLREHMLLHSERCETYEEFRDEVDTIAKARSANLLTTTPMDLGAFGKGGKKGKGKGSKGNWSKGGVTQTDSWTDSRGGGKGFGKAVGKGKKGGKPGASRSASQMSRMSEGSQSGRECYKCGGANHIAKDCRASEFKIRKYKEDQRRQRAQELHHEDPPSTTTNLALVSCADSATMQVFLDRSTKLVETEAIGC